ncbi:unnamed protein product [Linum tenue]|uniref:Nucleolar 27S pre-rRNA processing Urb2/Npa2 C-terminal domain-containing protein n=1 Tax=Linum tenue TaxID=586396 RepID=A0AAV0GW57_9ROSI|nr:unnamed protein product [Linum tenue]
MADLSVKSSKKKKRKAPNLDEKDRPSKSLRGDGSRERKEPQEIAGEGRSSALEELGASVEGGRQPWRNLELILLLQSKEVELSKKVEVAFNYVNGRGKERVDDVDEEFETVKVARLVVFLNNWVQSLLLSADKKLRVNEGELREACLDHRCWVILKFCLQESLRWQVSLSFSRNLLRALGCVAKNMYLHSGESSPVGDEVDFRTVVFDCASSMFVCHGGLSNENLDLWISTVQTVLELVKGIYQQKFDCGDADVLALKFSCLVLEAFSKFLRVHPTRKNGFRDFVDGLLDPLLCLLGILNHKLDGTGIAGNLLTAVEEILAHGVFHPTHIEGFLSLNSAGKYSSSIVDDQKETRTVLRSYHRHFFDKLEKVRAAKGESSFNGLGRLFRLLIDCLKRQKMAPLLSGDTKKSEKTESSKHVSGTESKMLHSYLTAEKRKSIFEFFVEIMEPLLCQMNVYTQAKLELDPRLLDVHSTMKSINELLECFLREKLYVKTEDVSGGACLNFLKKVYETVCSLATNFLCFFTYDMDAKEKTFDLLAREVFVAVGYLLEIEYEVTGNNLTSLWHMILSYFAVGHGFKSACDQESITSLFIGLGCQLIKLYSELRQVTVAISTLCKAIRLVVTRDNDGDGNQKGNNPMSFSCFSYDTYGKTLGLLLSSQGFRLALHNGIKSLPEGQASDCVHKICTDVSESIQWIKDSGSMEDVIKCDETSQRSCRTLHFNIREETFGRLSEVYTVVLDSLNVTAGNCNLVEGSLRDLVSTISPCMSILVGQESDNANQFLYFVTGRCRTEDESDLSAHWVFLFFCQLFMSCRSLYRQVISLMSPSLARKMSTETGDLHTAYSGKDWTERTEWTFEGYFSWIHQPSASLLDIIQSTSDYCFGKRIVNSSPLVYIFHAMALQRLVDLNRQFKSLGYILDNNDKIVKNKLFDDAGSSLYRKRSRKLGKHISVLKQEATDLTEYVMSYLSLVVGDQLWAGLSNVSSPESCPVEAIHEPYQWDWSVCSIHKSSLPIALWWIVCRNINAWSNHASKKKLKIFLSYMISSSLLCMGSSTMQVGKLHGNEAHMPSKISLHQISSELIMDINLYEYKFVCRLFTSRFCHLLERSVLSLFAEFMIMDTDLSSSPDWQEVLNKLGNLPAVIPRSKQLGCFSSGEKVLEEGFVMRPHSSKELIEFKCTSCQKLLNLLSWVPKGYMNSRSFSLLMTYVLNLERLIIGYLVNYHSNWSYKHHELLKLFVCCRRALRYTIMAFCEDGVAQRSPDIPVVSGNIHVVHWLIKSVSVTVGLQETPPQDYVDEVRGAIFSIMDHTSYIFLTLSKYQSSCAFRSSLARKASKQLFGSNVVEEQSTLTESNPSSDDPEELVALQSFLLLSESLKKESEHILNSLNAFHCNDNLNDEVGAVNLHKLSSAVSCFSGFLWGLASASDDSHATDKKLQEQFLGSKSDLIATIRSCMNLFSEFVRVCLYMFQAEDKYASVGLLDAWKLSFSVESDTPCCKYHVKCQGQGDEKEKPDIGSEPQNMLSEDKHSTTILVGGSHPEGGNLIRQLLLASSAILKLNLKMKVKTCSTLVSSSISISEVLLLKFTAVREVPKPYSFIWLDGVLKYLQELGSQICSSSSASPNDPYTQLVELHLKAIGKCISLQGKGANLASHDTETSFKVIPGHSGSPEVSLSHGPHYLHEFIARMRLSFQVLVRKSPEWHLLSAVQTIERALVGVHESYAVIYQITFGGANGGSISPTVAAGIDCLDLVLEYVSGTKQLNVVKKHIQSLLSTLFNIVLHLQGPSIFTRREASVRNDICPDPGAVILMCVEVVTRVSAKSSLFHMDSFHVAQSLRLPAALFEDFSQLRYSEGLDRYLVKDMNPPSHVDRHFSVELYAACCRLLCTILKYHRSESERCIALLQESASVLLNCLEIVDSDSGSKRGYFSWNTEEGVKCACFFRRIYEELRQQRDVFGQYCCKFLSSYIWLYSGMGPHKTGIKREVDEALKPGVYALIDACPAEDLQSLHDVFGEGPCRNTLAALQHDYKLNFQYEGKV